MIEHLDKRVYVRAMEELDKLHHTEMGYLMALARTGTAIAAHPDLKAKMDKLIAKHAALTRRATLKQL